MKSSNSNNIYMDFLKKIKIFFYKIIIGEIFINQYKKDTRSKIARVIDLFVPTLIANIFIFLVIFSYLNSIFASFIFCMLITFVFFKSLKLVKTIIYHYLEDIYDLKERVKNNYLLINNLNQKEFEDYCYQLLSKINKSTYSQWGSFSNLSENIKLKIIFGCPERDEENSIVSNFKNEILSSNNHYGILILNYPESKELVKLVESYRKKSIINLFVIDIYGIINLAITHDVNIESNVVYKSAEGQFKNNLGSFNQQLIYSKKKIYGHVAVASLLGIIGIILDSFGTIYITLSLFNVILALISLYNYLNIINILLPGNIDNKILTNFQK